MTFISFNRAEDAYGWMSNSSSHSIYYKGDNFPTAEHLFQFMRYESEAPVSVTTNGKIEVISPELLKKEILVTPDPVQVKGVGRRYRKLWPVAKERDIEVMGQVIRRKVIPNKTLAALLVATEGDIYYDVTVGSGSGKFWGAVLLDDGSWDGENHLGKIWMQVREELKSPRK